MKKLQASKNDTNKLRYDLIPWFGHQELARVFTIGARKYGENNWRGGFKWSRLIAALERHTAAFKRGEKYDSEDHQLHLSSVAWCAYILMEFDEFKIGEDDRIKNESSSTRHSNKKVSKKRLLSLSSKRARSKPNRHS